MRKIAIAVIMCILLASNLTFGCGQLEKGSGNLKTESFDYRDFTRVNISSAFNIEIEKAGFYSVVITADDNIFKYIDVAQTGSTLRIGMKTTRLFQPLTLKARITMPELRSVELSGASKGFISGFSSKDDLEIELSGASSLELVDISSGDLWVVLSGASKITGNIKTTNAKFELSGASHARTSGSAADIFIDASGLSNVELASLEVNNAEVNLSGASNCTVNSSGRLNADLSGASKLEYMDAPVLGKINTSGASTIRNK